MTHFYDALADLLEYPGEAWAEQLRSCRELLSPGFIEFDEKVETLPLATLQELYTRTFDLNPVCTLDVGYHLFGENYKRGVFLANLRETESPYSLGQQHQLPDYLPVLLRLLVRLDDLELRAALISYCLMPAIDKMIAALSETDNLYTKLIETIGRALKLEVPQPETGLSQRDPSMARGMPELHQIVSRAAMKW